MLKIYYLIYKINNNPLLWIIRSYNNRTAALGEFKHYKKSKSEYFEKFMLVERTVSRYDTTYIEKELEYKQFAKFTISNDDDLISYI